MNTTATSVSAELTEQVLRTLERARQPLTFFPIQRGLPRPYQNRTDEIRQILQEEVTRGRIHQFPPYRSKTPRFWTRDTEQFARAVIVEVLNERPCTQRELLLKIRRRLQGMPDGRLREVLSQMLLDGPVRNLPPRVGCRSNLLSAREVQPRDYLTPVFDSLFDTLGDVSRRLESEGVGRETFRQETEAMWRAMPWDHLGEGPLTRPAPSSGAPPFEPASAATEPPLPPEADGDAAGAPPSP